MPQQDGVFFPYIKMDGGSLPQLENWDGVLSQNMQDTRYDSIPVSKIDWSEDIDMGDNVYFGVKWDTAQVKTVATSGAPYKYIEDALDSVGDNASTKPYVVKIMDGIFNESDLACKPYVNYVGQGHQHTIIKSDTVSNGLLSIGSDCSNGTIEIADLTLELNEGVKPILWLDNAGAQLTGATIVLSNCRIRTTATATEVFCLFNPPSSGGNKIFFNNCIFEGSSASNRVCIFYTSNNAYMPNTDTIYINNPILINARIGNIGLGSGTASTTKLYINGGTQEVAIATTMLVIYQGVTAYVEGVR